MEALRPLALGALIDRSATVWRAAWRPLFQLFIGFQLGQYILLKAWNLLTLRYAPAMQGGAKMAELAQNDPGGFAAQMAVGSAGLLGTIFITLLMTEVASVATSHFIYPRLTGGAAPTVTASLAFAWQRFGRTAVAFTLSLGWALGVTLALQVPTVGLVIVGALLKGSVGTVLVLGLALFWGVAAAVVAMLWFFLRFMLLSQALGLEDGTALDAFRRAGALSSGRVEPGLLGLVKVRLTVLLTVVAGLLLTVTFVTSLPSLAIQVIYGNIFDPAHATPEAVPQLLLVPAELLQLLVTTLVTPLYVVFQVVFYVDMLVRREGLDLKLKLGASA
jgi:hypothetical protein